MKMSALSVCSAVLQFRMEQQRKDDSAFFADKFHYSAQYDEHSMSSITGLSVEQIRHLKRHLS